MKFLKKIEFSNVNDGYFIVSKNIILLQQMHEVKLINFSSSSCIASISTNKKHHRFDTIGTKFIGFFHGGYTIFSSSIDSSNSFEFSYSGTQIVLGKYLFRVVDTNYSTFESKLGLYDLSSNNLVWELDYGKGQLKSPDGESIFYLNSNKIERIEIITGYPKWEDSYENESIPEIISVNRKTLILCLDSIDRVKALNFVDGVPKWEINTFAKGLKVDTEKGVLHQMLVNYTAYDLETGEMIEFFKTPEYFESCGIESQRSNYVLIDDHIITTDWRKGNIGAFNTKTHKFDWMEKIEGVSFPSPKPMKFSNPYLLVHDSNNTLHIFEKEK